MHLSAVISKDDLTALIAETAPLDVELARRPRWVVSLGRPSLVELVAGVGLRVRSDARFAWDLAGVSIPVVVRSWQILLRPMVEMRDGEPVLAFDPLVEALDISSVPGFVEESIKGAIHAALAANRSKLAWRFARSLAARARLPETVSPPSIFVIGPTGGDVEVTSSEVRLTMHFAAHMVKSELGRTDSERPTA